MKNIFSTLFGRNKNAYDKLEIRFHKQANVYGEHGTINVTHVKQGLVEIGVRFVFVGVTTPPKLSRNIFNFIWEEALAQGYIPHHIETYGTDNEIASPVKAAEAADVSGVKPAETAARTETPSVWRQGQSREPVLN